MKLYKEQNSKFKYVFEFEFEDEVIVYCRYIKSVYGISEFKFNDGKWRFNNLDILYLLTKKFPDIETHYKMYDDILLHENKKKQEALKKEKAIRLKSAKTSDIFIKNMNIELYPYQKVGVEFIDNNNGRAIIADSMGIGKTAQALGYLSYKNIDKALVICPASMKYTWSNETSKFTKLKSFVVDSATPLTREAMLDNSVIIINYDLIKKYFDDLKNYGWDVVIMDEFHMIKNSQAQRTKAAKAIASKVKSVILLSGTPMLSRPVELFNGLNLVDPSTWNDYYSFTTRYCNGHRGPWGWEAKGASNIEELQERINKYFIRRTKDEVLPDLPEKQFSNQPVKLEKEWMKKYKLAEESFIEYLREIKKKIIKDEDFSTNKLVKLNELRSITSEGKVWAAEELINSIVDSGEKVLVFSVYNKPLEDLFEKFKDRAVMITGKTDNKERQDMVDKFQNDKNISIFFGGMKSAGVGITLTAASNVIFIDYSWVPADHEQAQDRAHRIGQTASSVNVYQLYSKGTIDEEMTRILKKKQKLFDQIIDGKELSNSNRKASLFDDVIKMLENK